MSTLKKLGGAAAIVLAMVLLSAPAASAVGFTANPGSGSLTGKALETQVFTTNGGQVKCNTAEIGGAIAGQATFEQKITVFYKNCTAFGFASVDVTPGSYLLTADGEVRILETIMLVVTVSMGFDCWVKIKPQFVAPVKFSNNGSNLKLIPNVSGIVYETGGTIGSGLCGASGSNGTFKGAAEIGRFGGGTMSWDA